MKFQIQLRDCSALDNKDTHLFFKHLLIKDGDSPNAIELIIQDQDQITKIQVDLFQIKRALEKIAL